MVAEIAAWHSRSPLLGGGSTAQVLSTSIAHTATCSQRTTAGSLSLTVLPVSTDSPSTLAMFVRSPGAWQRAGCSSAGISPCVRTTLWPAARSPTAKSTMPSWASLTTTFTRSLVPVLVTVRRYSAPLPTLVDGAPAGSLASRKVTPPSTLTSLTMSMRSRTHLTTAGSLSLTVLPVGAEVPFTLAMLVTLPGVAHTSAGASSGIWPWPSTRTSPTPSVPTTKSSIPSVVSFTTTSSSTVVPVLVTVSR